MRRVFACFLIGAALAIFTTAPARASAIGVAPVTSFTYSFQGVTVKVPVGCFLTHKIRGDDRVVTAERAGVDCAGAGLWSGGFCNSRIDLQYYDVYNRIYLTNPGRTDNSCIYDPLRDGPARVLPRFGKACAVLYVNGVARARQCHSIST